jgi:hypothetical protein
MSCQPAQKRKTDPWYAPGLRFTCTRCGNCCTGPPGYVWFDKTEQAAMAEFLNLPIKQFMARYARKLFGKMTLTERKTTRGHDCIFLRFDEDGHSLCEIYPVRPAQCRTWPFWPENLRRPDDYARAAQRCPGMAAGLKGKGDFVPIEQIRIRVEATS